MLRLPWQLSRGLAEAVTADLVVRRDLRLSAHREPMGSVDSAPWTPEPMWARQ